jgi:hypothetical protein
MPINRGVNFTDYEMQQMLDLIDVKKPVHTNDWESIGRLHAQKFPDKHRTGNAIKRKFMVLYLTKTPPGDPSCPPNVRRAKEIYHKIKGRANLGIEVQDDEEEDENSDEGNDDIAEPVTVDLGNPVPTNDSFPLSSASIPPTYACIAPTNASITRTNTSIPAIRTRQESIKEPEPQTGLKKQRIDEESSMEKFLHYLIIQNQMDKEERREERKRQQEEERVRREEERIRYEEERAQRQQQNNMMQMMMFSLISSNPLLAQTQQQLGLPSPTQVNASTSSSSPIRIMNSAATTGSSSSVHHLDNEVLVLEMKNDNDEEA